MQSKRRLFKRHNKTKRGGMDRLKKLLNTKKSADDSQIDYLVDKSETQDLENISMRSKQDAVINMMTDLNNRVDNTKFPDNMAMFAGPSQYFFHYGSVAEDFYIELDKGKRPFGIPLEPKHLLNFPKVNNFDMLRYVYICGGIIVDDDIKIDRNYVQSQIANVNQFISSFKHIAVSYAQNNDLALFNENNMESMKKLYAKYPNLFKNPEMVTIGNIQGARRLKITPNGNLIYEGVPEHPVLFPYDYLENSYYRNLYDIFINTYDSHGQRKDRTYNEIFIKQQ